MAFPGFNKGFKYEGESGVYVFSFRSFSVRRLIGDSFKVTIFSMNINDLFFTAMKASVTN